jgi:hypothetical protein
MFPSINGGVVPIIVDATKRLEMMEEFSKHQLEMYADEIAKTVYDVDCSECNAGKGMHCRIQVPKGENKLGDTWKLTSKVHMGRIENAIRLFFQEQKNR